MVAAMLAIPFVAGAQCMPVVVASGDSTGSAYTAPVNNYYNYSLSEMIFDAEEFAGAMTIDTIGFYLGSMNTMSFASDVRIYLKYTEKGGFASTSDYEVVDASAVLVYQGPLSCVHGWNNYALSTPFYYDGDGNLMVIVHDNSSGQDGTSRKFATSSTGSEYKTLVRYSDSQNPVPGSATYGGSSARYQYRPVMRLAGCEAAAATCRRLTNLAVDTVAQTSATISWVDVYNSGATYSVSMNAGGADTLLASGLTATFFTATGLAPNTQYSFLVRAHCGGGAESLPAAVDVRTECGVLGALPHTWTFENEELQGGTNALRLPWCMERYSTGSGSYTYYPYSASTNSAYAHSGTRYLYFYPGGSASYPDTQAVVLPQLDVTAYPMDGNRISFWCRTNSATGNGVLYVGTVSDPSNIGSFTLVDTVQVQGTDMRHCVVPLTGSPSTNAYVALVVLRGGTGYLALDDLTLEQLPQCGDVQHLQVDSTTDTTVSLSWDAVAGATYTVYDMAVGTVVASAVAANSYTVGGLNGQTTYTFGVRANCTDGDGVVATLTVQTACAPAVLPYVEDFEAGGNYGCWTTVQTAASTGLNSSHPYSGSSAFRFYYSANPPQYLVSPLLAGTGDGVQLEFSYANEDNGYPESFAVGYSTTSNAPSSFTWLPEVTDIATGRQYVRYSEILSAPGIKYVAIKCTSNDQYYLYIDSLVVTEAPNCLPVSNLTVDSASTGSVWLSWSDLSNDGATYTVYMDTVALAVGLSDTEYEVEDLDPATAYTFSVVANCSPEDASEAVSVSALTECGAESCLLSFYCTDYYSDGWNGAYISVVQSGTEMGTVACAVSNETYTVQVCSGAPVALMWHGGQYDEEAIFTVRDGGGDSVFACAMEEADQFPQTSPFFTLATPCPACLVPVVTVDSVGTDAVAISWTEGNAIGYNVYVNDTIVEAQGITDNSYTITGLAASTDYTVSVEAICSASDTSARGTVQVVTECGGGRCDIVIVTGESGLLGAGIDVMQGAAVVESFYDVSSMMASDTISVCSGVPITFVYHQTPYVDYGFAGMISFTVTNGGGAQIYDCASGTNMVDGDTFLTIADACPSCSTPQVELASMTETTATIRWTATAGSYDILLDGVPVQAGVADSTYTFTGLSAATDYVFGVVAVCSAGDTADVATLSVRTPCSPVGTLPYAESFDEGLGCWTTVSNSADGQPWFYQGSDSYLASHSGSGMAMSVSYTTHAVNADAWLVSPQVVLPAAGSDSLLMSWWFAVDGEYPEDNYEVRISTTTNEVASFTIQLDNVEPTALNGEWTQRTVDLTPYAGQAVYVAFHHYNSYDADFLAIDDVEIYESESGEPEVTYYEVDVSSGDARMGSVSSSVPTGQVAEGTVMTVSATPADGYRFLRWTDGGADVSTDNPYTFTVSADVHLVALFEASVGIVDVEGADVTVYSAEGRIVVRGAEGRDVCVYDVNGRCVRQLAAAEETEEIAVSASGVYMVKVGEAAASRVVVVR